MLLRHCSTIEQSISAFNFRNQARCSQIRLPVIRNNKTKFGQTLTYHYPSFFQKVYVAQTGRDECAKDEKFWINFQTWKERTYGARGPSISEWDEILNEE